MAAGNFGASALLRANVKLDDMFEQPLHTNTELNVPANVLRALITNQTADTVDRLEGNKCVGVKAWYFRSNTEDDTETPEACETPMGDEIETLAQNYDHEILAEASQAARDNRCDNEAMFEDESAYAMRTLIAKLRKKLNLLAISRLSAQAQVNMDTMKPEDWDDESQAPKILVPESQFVWENMGEFDTVVNNNLFGSYYWISGRNFYNDYWRAQHTKFNSDGKAEFSAYQEAGIHFDRRDLDRTLGAKHSFAVDRNGMIFWNYYFSTSTPEEVDDNVFVWIIADPELSYMKDGQLTPVYYEIEMKKTCISRTPTTQRQYKYTFYGRALGGLKWAPNGPNGEKGVLDFQAN